MKKATAKAGSSYVVTMPMGLDVITVDELADRVRDADIEERTSTEIRFRSEAPSAIAGLRSVSDAYVVVREVSGIGPTYRDLRRLKESLAGTRLDAALATLSQLGTRPKHPLTFSVACSLRGRRAYRRLDALKAAEEALASIRGMALRSAEQKSDLRFWLHLEDDRGRLCMALTPKPVGLRDRAVSLPTSLTGPVAYAMASLTRPHAGQVFADLACGSGSILLERAENWRYTLLVGGDLAEEAIAATAANFGPRHRPREFLVWDATRLPLASESVDALACNPPHGIQMQPEGGLRNLYRGILAEAARVLRPNGVLTFLTPERALTDAILREIPALRIRRCFVVDLRGQRPYLYALTRS